MDVDQDDHACQCTDTIKIKKSNAERCMKYRKKIIQKDPLFKDKERKRIAQYRETKKSNLTPEEKTVLREKERLRKKEYRSKHTSTKTPIQTPQQNHATPCPYDRPQSLGKAIQRVFRRLPFSPRKKKKAVISGIADKIGLNLENKMITNISNANNNGLPNETVQLIQDFYYRTDIVYTMPGMKDEITIWMNGSKEKKRKYYLTLFLREAYSIYCQVNPDYIISFPKFCSLRPKNVLLLHETPADQCRCRIHENFIMKLNGLKIHYDSQQFWESHLCD
ncbi:hypothetical protein SNE40_018123 [Patella caerulea]|uniref:Uncharacterized protein n=1 Tax=Patella caerulea TaxID=87958 RepID=A0AAN8J945_PATCE